MSTSGYGISIPDSLYKELRAEVRAGRMTFNQFDRRVAEEVGKTGPRSLMRFVFEDILEEDR